MEQSSVLQTLKKMIASCTYVNHLKVEYKITSLDQYDKFDCV